MFAEIEAGEFASGTRADDDFVPARIEAASLHDLDIAAHIECLLLDATEWHIRTGAGRSFRKIDNDKELRRRQRPAQVAGNSWWVADDTCLLPGEAARHFTVRAASQND